MGKLLASEFWAKLLIIDAVSRILACLALIQEADLMATLLHSYDSIPIQVYIPIKTCFQKKERSFNQYSFLDLRLATRKGLQ